MSRNMHCEFPSIGMIYWSFRFGSWTIILIEVLPIAKITVISYETERHPLIANPIIRRTR